MVEAEDDHMHFNSLTIGNGLEELGHSRHHHHHSSIPDHLSQTAFSKHRSMVFIRDASLDRVHDAAAAADDDLHVFPPSSHENLVPSSFDLHSPKYPSPPLVAPSSPPPVLASEPENSPDSSVSPLTGWWAVALEVMRSKIVNLGSCFKRNVVGCGRNNRTASHSFCNVAFAVATVAVWWLLVRIKRWRRRREHVGHLLQIIREKDEKIIQLLNQIVQMNELLLTRHKALATKLPAASG